MVTALTYRADMAKAMSERQLQDQVVAMAKTFGWLVFHPYDSRRSQAGFPDLTMVRGGRLLFAELKTMRGKLTDAQTEWGVRLARATPDMWVWRPDALLSGEIEAVLR